MYRAPLLTAELLQRVLLGALGDDPRREPLEAVLAMVSFLRGRNEDVERTTRQLLARTTDVDRAAEMSWLLGYTLMRAGRFSEAVEVVSTAPATGPWANCGVPGSPLSTVSSCTAAVSTHRRRS